MASAHASSQDGRVLPTLPAARRLVAKRGVRRREACLEEQVVGGLVAEPVGMLAPRPEVGVFDGLRGQL